MSSDPFSSDNYQVDWGHIEPSDGEDADIEDCNREIADNEYWNCQVCLLFIQST